MPLMIAPEIAQVLPEIRALCERQGVERMSLFGSVTTKDFSSESSDVDCLIKFAHSGKLDIPDLSKIIGLRNRIVHGYDFVNHELVSTVFQVKLPLLQARLLELLQ